MFYYSELCTSYVFQHFNFKAEWYLSLILTKQRNSSVNLIYRANSALQCDFRLVADKVHLEALPFASLGKRKTKTKYLDLFVRIFCKC